MCLNFRLWVCLLIGLLTTPLLWAEQYTLYPEPDSGYVSDHADLLSYEEEERIERWLWQVESRTQVEIIVVTIQSISDYSTTYDMDIESFASGMFNHYGIGNLPKNDGILLLVASEDRKARIELGKHYGRARDSDANAIMQNIIIPNFKKGDYAGGITDGTEAIIKTFAGLRIGFPWHIVGIVVAAIISLLVGVSLIKSGKKGWGYVLVGLAIVLVLLAVYLVVQIVRHMPDSDSDGWSSGGMGGFGGGSIGGGGATGSW